MNVRARVSLVVCALLFGISLVSCGGDDDPSGPTDDTPPAIASITPVDAYHLDVRFSEPVAGTSAQNQSNYVLTEIAAAPVAPGASAAPGDQIYIGAASLASDKQTVTLATPSSMNGRPFGLFVSGVADLTGNEIGESGTRKSFASSSAPDNTAPSVVSHTPSAGATDVDARAPVVLTFSEGVNTQSINWTSDGGGVPAHAERDGLNLILTPNGGYHWYGSVHTVNVTYVDFAGNAGSPLQFTFTTAPNPDHTVPTVASSNPHNLATNVSVNAKIALTFSEPMLQTLNSVLSPPIPVESTTWSNGGKTVTLAYNAPFADDTQYTLSIPNHGAWDLYDHGTDDLYTLTFTTGSQIENGSISGMEWGDAGSAADDATGALVMVAPSAWPNFPQPVTSSARVDNTGHYDVLHLPDGTYYVLSVIDTNHDGILDPSYGDAVGGFGFSDTDLDFDPVTITGGAHVTGKDFVMYDPSSVSGYTTYNGDQQEDNSGFPWPDISVGLFAVAGFNGWNSAPLITTSLANGHDWEFTTLATNLDEGDYYVGAFFDINHDNMYEASEPVGFYGGSTSPTVLHMKNGTDYLNINILMVDPTDALVASPPVPIHETRPDPALQRLLKIVRQSQAHTSR